VEARSFRSEDGALEALLESPEPPRSSALDRNATNIGRALDLALELVRVDQPTAVVLVSDGLETNGSAVTALRSLEAVGVRVVTLPLTYRTDDPDGWIASLRATPEVRVGENVRVVVGIDGSRRADAKIAIRVDGELAEERSILIDPESPERVELELPIPASGVHRIEAHLMLEGDRRPENDRREALVHAGGSPNIELVSRDAGTSGLRAPTGNPVSESDAGVRTWLPEAFDGWMGRGEAADVIVLDDIGISDLSDASWERLQRIVEHQGTGLLVLGGPNSFGSGGYRHSRLEGLLPATAEAREPREPVAVLFVVDTSGSMDRDREGRRRIALARQAIAETLLALEDEDWVGVSTFAVEPRERLAFGHHARDPERVKAAVPDPSGGTRLVPALRHGAARLSNARAKERILVLVTDGFVDDFESGGDASALQRELAAAKVQLVALAVGANVQLGVLEQLVAQGGAPEFGGRLLRVNQLADLPKLMRSEVERRLDPIAWGPLEPRIVTPLPFPLPAVAGDWPPLEATAVTRPRPGAVVHLESADATPLLVSHDAGAGRVAILPGGLGPWATAWNTWPGLPAFAAGLVEWLARPANDPRLQLRLSERPDGIAFEIDALGHDGEWTTAPAATVRVTNAADIERSLEVTATAAGLYRGTLRAPLPGMYRVSATVDGRTVVRHALRSSNREFAIGSEVDGIDNWVEAGLTERWEDGALPEAFTPPSQAVLPRPWLSGLALSSYLALLAYEQRGRPLSLRERNAARSG